MQEFEKNLVLLIGAMKAGTNTLYYDLGQHPSIYAPQLKEPFILANRYTSQSVVQEYLSHFKAAPAGNILLDGSTGYTMQPDYPDSAKIAFEVGIVPKLIIYLIREPFGRIISHFRHSVGSGDMVSDFKLALRQDSRLIDYTRYHFQLQPWLKTFNAERVHVMTTDYFVENRHKAVGEIFSLINLEPDLLEFDFSSIKNVGSRKRIPPWLGRYIRKALPGDRYRQLRGLIPQSFRQGLLNAVARPLPQVSANFSDDDLEFVWNNLASELMRIAPSINHTLQNQKTIWDKDKLFQQYREIKR